MSLDFWLTSIVVTATPGTGALFTIAAGLARGVRAGLIAALGCTLGIVPHIALALSGVAAVFVTFPAAFALIKWLGVAYLLYMAWGTWQQTGVFDPGGDGPSPGTGSAVWRVIGSAVLVNLLNPKLTLFFFVFLPLFTVPADGHPVANMAVLGLLFMGITLAIFALYGACAAWLRVRLLEKPVSMRWLQRAFAVTFVALAGILAITRQ